jgi:uncharacterized protein YdhG (YjbR/CyaY superfamily)
MIKKTTVAKNVDGYIAGFPENTQKLLVQLRALITKAAPQAEEGISYQMPAYKFHGPLVYFGGCQNHIGFYPTGSGISNFSKELSAFKTSKGTVQFPLDKKLPASMISQIVKFRVLENKEKAELKLKNKKKV